MNLPKRKKIRLKDWDYSTPGAYFITICVQNKNVSLRDVSVGADIIRPNDKIPPLSKYGEIADIAINEISNHYDNIFVDKYCIMPDHIHMIIFVLSDDDGRIISAPTISTVIGSMKRWVSKQIGMPIWQKSFNDEIIRNKREYEEIWEYIDENPLKWELDKMNIPR